MDEENAFVDVCGDGDGPCEEDKENIAPQLLLQMAAGTSSGSQNGTSRGGKEEEGSGPEEALAPAGPGQQPAECLSPSAAAGRRRLSASRKDKSLGKLCGPFLARVGQEAAQGRDVHLESIARAMCVEKRRIYDIVNVMEALEVMQKTNKSFYKCHGLGRLPMLMHALQSEAQRGELPKRIAEAEGAMCRFAEFDGTSSAVPSNQQQCPAGMERPVPGEEDPAFGPLASRDRCGKNSLAQLCRRFLMVLLCNPERRRVSLDVVSTLLINDPLGDNFEPPSRSRCRRLYDIANVLVEMRLVQKRNSMFGTKKIPLFEYCGPEPDANAVSAEARMRQFQERTGLAIGQGKVPMPMEDGGGGRKRRRREEEDEPAIEQQPSSSSAPARKVPKLEVADENCERKNARPVLGQQNGTGNGQAKANGQKWQNVPPSTELPRPQPLLPSAFVQPAFPPPLQPLPVPAPPPPPPPQPLFTSFAPPHFWHSPHPHLAIAADRLAQQLFAYSAMPPPPPPPIAVPNSSPPPKVRHSVQSILGVSQRENIAAGKQQSSPRAFKPVQHLPQPSSFGGIGTGKADGHLTKAKLVLPFGQRQQQQPNPR